MLQTIRIALMLAAVVTAAREARAQYGYGYARGYGGYGWGGWGSTPGSSMARGLGMLNMGRGMYNVSTAQAASINTNTVMRFNQAMYNAHAAGAQACRWSQEESRGGSQGLLRDPDRLRKPPNERDVTDGDALNVLLDVLLNPANADAAASSRSRLQSGRT